jgi:hypothetical protein
MPLGIIGGGISTLAQNQLAGSYTDQNFLVDQPFGVVSHWIYPSRAYLTTVPASQFINGVGVNFTFGMQNNAGVEAEMLAKYGFKHVRIEIDWGELDYDKESSISSQSIINRLTAAKNHGLRPLIVLNANQGNPCPFRSEVHTVNVDALKGATTVQIKPGEDISQLKVGYSGISLWQYIYTMNYALVTAIDTSTNTITLSQPLPITLTAGTSLDVNTFKYRPFDSPNDPYYNAVEQQQTLTGWNNYVVQIAKRVSHYLGTTPGSADMGFDMELWNELTFGSQYLVLPVYYGQYPPPSGYSLGDVIQNVLNTTISAFSANPAQFGGVVLEDGFANEDPYHAASSEPAQVGALGKHPYPDITAYPAGQTDAAAMLNALYFLGEYPQDYDVPNNPPTPPYFPFVPTYTEYMPEYYGTTLQTETIIRDLTPITTSLYGVLHGENSRTDSNGNVIPCTVFISEIGFAPNQLQLNPPVLDQSTALLIKAKGDARALAFYLNEGASQVDLYADFGGQPNPYPDTDFGVLSDNFYTYVANLQSTPTPNAPVPYPSPDATYLTPALTLIANMVEKMEYHLDPLINNSNTRTLTVNSISDNHNNYQFQGDGTPAHPPGYDREAFQFLPYQVNVHRFVIPFYVMTRDIAHHPLTPEAFTIDLSGINAVGATFTVYDPLNNSNVSLTVNSRKTNEVNLTLTAADYPYLLIVQETAN